MTTETAYMIGSVCFLTVLVLLVVIAVLLRIKAARGRGRMSSAWKQERPSWCGHHDCVFRKRHQDSMCGGDLPTPADHGDAKAVNNHRVCIRFEDDNETIDMQCNNTDLDYFRSVFDALDGKKTSWLTREKP